MSSESAPIGPGLGTGPARRSEASPRVGDLTRLIGGTSLLRLPSLEPSPAVTVYAKAEWENPGGSVKDRAALAMIREGERSGALHAGKTLIDASSGNTGIAYAMLGAALGYAVRLVLPGNATRSRLEILRAYGAEVELTDAQEGMDGAIARARETAASDPERYFYPDQYNNPANWKAHYRGTGEEILRQTAGGVTHFVAGLGTTGTFTGVGRRLREFNRGIGLIGVQPDSPLHVLEGVKHLATTAHVPGIFDSALVDAVTEVSSEAAQAMARRLAREEGVLAGPSAAAAAVAAERVARSLTGGVVVTVFPDGAQKYLDEPFWREG